MRALRPFQGTLAAVLFNLMAVGWAGAQDTPPRGPDGDPNRVSSGVAESRLRLLLGILRRMDADGSGSLESEEVAERVRPYVRRCAELAGLDPSGPLALDALEDALWEQYGNRSRSPSPAPRPTLPPATASADEPVPGFGPVNDQPPIPGFGPQGQGAVRVERVDRERAADRLRRYDSNRDGYMDRREAGRGRWSDDPFRYDRNQDGKLSLRELAERYAKRRLDEQSRSDRSRSSSSRGQSGRGSSEEERRRAREEEQRRRERYRGMREHWRLAMSLMGRYDLDDDDVLNRNESRSMGIPSAAADTDLDGRVDRGELAQWLAERSAKSTQPLPRGLPTWFAQRDADGDGQVMMAEFAEEWDEQKAAEFAEYDLNRDGVIMPQECLDASGLPGGTFANRRFQLIPPRRTIYSEIEVPDDTVVSDLNVQLSITHTWDERLDAFLIGPDEERIELFTGVGDSDDHFDNTILDDEARTPIVRARPPFAGRYHPEAVSKRQPSLRRYSGKDIGGTWTLMIRAERSERAGVLHGWSLITQPAEEASPGDEEDEEAEEAEDEQRSGPPSEGRPEWRRDPRWGRPGGRDEARPRPGAA